MKTMKDVLRCHTEIDLIQEIIFIEILVPLYDLSKTFIQILLSKNYLLGVEPMISCSRNKDGYPHSSYYCFIHFQR